MKRLASKWVTLLTVATLMGGCDSPSNGTTENEGGGGKSDSTVAEDAFYVYVAQPLEDLDNDSQVRGYEYAVDTVVRALEKSPVGEALPDGATRPIRDLRLKEVLPNLQAELAGYGKSLEEAGYAIPSQLSLIPSGLMVFLGIPASASAGVGISGGATIVGIIKLHRVTRVDKETGEFDEDYESWRIEFSPRVILRAGGGVGAGGGLGVHAGVGFIWGELARAEDFSGTTVLASVSPLSGIVGPVVMPGLRWDGSVEDQPDNFYLMVGVETGANAKAFETHIQGGRIPELWSWLSNLLGFAKLTEANNIDPLTQEPLEELNGGAGGGKSDDTEEPGSAEQPESVVFFVPGDPG